MSRLDCHACAPLFSAILRATSYPTESVSVFMSFLHDFCACAVVEWATVKSLMFF